MAWALRDEASIESAISTTRLPSPRAATSQVFSRMNQPPSRWHPPKRTGIRPVTGIPPLRDIKARAD